MIYSQASCCWTYGCALDSRLHMQIAMCWQLGSLLHVADTCSAYQGRLAFSKSQHCKSSTATSVQSGYLSTAGPHAGPYDPNDPNAPPPQPPSAWQHMLHVVGGVMHFFGRLSFLVDENAHAVHFFVSALLQLLDRWVPAAACHSQLVYIFPATSATAFSLA